MTSDTPEDLSGLGGAPAEVRALQHACAAVDSGLVVVAGPDVALVHAVVLAVARHDATHVWDRRTGASTGHLDVYDATPTETRWTVEAVEQLIVAPARVRPLERSHIVVANAHTITQPGVDRLLKVVEEPRNDVLFWFCVRTPDSLSPTLRSRAARILSVRPLTPTEQWDTLIAAGAQASTVARLITASQGSSRLALAAGAGGHLEALETYAALPMIIADAQGRAAPTRAAHDHVRAVAVLATALNPRTPRVPATSEDARKAWEDLSPQLKAEGRQLLIDSIDAGVRHLQGLLSGALTRSELRHLESGLAACARAKAELVTNAHPILVIAALLSRSSLPPS